MTAERGQFSSRMGFILAAAGSAVGLGNLVGFPVMAAKNGGAAFLVVYLGFVILVCFPVMLAEIAMGRSSQRNPVGAFAALSNNSRLGRAIGTLAIITPFMIGVFYSVITIWILVYMARILGGDLELLSSPSAFGEVNSSPSLFLYFIALFAIVFTVLLGGVRGGIERLAKILMPTLAVMLVLLTIFVLTLDNAGAGVSFYLVPDFSKINGTVINGALSQAFFSLSLGMGILITYGSYFSRQESIVSSTRMVAIADTSIAFFAGLLILPAIFAFDPEINPDDLSTSSVGLIFSFLPQIFLSMQSTVGFFGASVVAFTFFTLVFFAALTSLVSIIEIPIAYLIDEWDLTRKKAVIVQATALGLFTILATMSFGMSGFLTEFINYGGAPKSFFDLVYDVFYETILPLVGFTVCIYCAYRWKNQGLSKELSVSDEKYSGSLLEKYINISIGTIIPFILFFVFVNTVAQKYFSTDLLTLLSF